MALFRETLKLYYKREENLVTLSFLVSPNYVQTYYFSREEFEQVLERAESEEGFLKPGIFVQRKRDYFRWSFDTVGVTHQIRVENEKWSALVGQYRSQMRDSTAPLVTCVVG